LQRRLAQRVEKLLESRGPHLVTLEQLWASAQ
jgi:hypothetical protein